MQMHRVTAKAWHSRPWVLAAILTLLLLGSFDAAFAGAESGVKGTDRSSAGERSVKVAVFPSEHGDMVHVVVENAGNTAVTLSGGPRGTPDWVDETAMIRIRTLNGDLLPISPIEFWTPTMLRSSRADPAWKPAMFQLKAGGRLAASFRLSSLTIGARSLLHEDQLYRVTVRFDLGIEGKPRTTETFYSCEFIAGFAALTAD